MKNDYRDIEIEIIEIRSADIIMTSPNDANQEGKDYPM
jgi:hypothetical protein